MRHYTNLKDIAEQYRNPYSHGDFDKHGATIGFQVEGLDALPAVLLGIRDTPEFTFLPSHETDYTAICQQLDGVETWLSTGPAADAWTWITNGFDFRFDATFRRELAVARADEKSFRDYMERNSEAMERAWNIDW